MLKYLVKKIISTILEFRVNIICFLKRKKMIKNVSKSASININEVKLYRNRWSKLSERISPDYLSIFGNTNLTLSFDYVPENLYYTKIEPVTNLRHFALAYADKNFYEKYLHEYKYLFPDTILRGINYLFYDKHYNTINDINEEVIKLISENKKELIIKPSVDTAGGYGVKKIMGIDISVKSTKEYMKLYNGNFVVQDLIISLPWFNEFNQSSLNTVRIFTYKSYISNETNILSSVLRFGRTGSIVDNQAAGGYTVGISNEGVLNDFAIDKMGTKYYPAPIKKYKNTKVPYFKEMCEIVKLISNNLYYHRLLAFDVTTDINGKICILEINFKNIETNFLQMNNGPLFGKFTDEIIDFCSINKKSIVLDYFI